MNDILNQIRLASNLFGKNTANILVGIVVVTQLISLALFIFNFNVDMISYYKLADIVLIFAFLSIATISCIGLVLGKKWGWVISFFGYISDIIWLFVFAVPTLMDPRLILDVNYLTVAINLIFILILTTPAVRLKFDIHSPRVALNILISIVTGFIIVALKYL
jgi:hypothetical protein